MKAQEPHNVSNDMIASTLRPINSQDAKDHKDHSARVDQRTHGRPAAGAARARVEAKHLGCFLGCRGGGILKESAQEIVMWTTCGGSVAPRVSPLGRGA